MTTNYLRPGRCATMWTNKVARGHQHNAHHQHNIGSCLRPWSPWCKWRSHTNAHLMSTTVRRMKVACPNCLHDDIILFLQLPQRTVCHLWEVSATTHWKTRAPMAMAKSSHLGQLHCTCGPWCSWPSTPNQPSHVIDSLQAYGVYVLISGIIFVCSAVLPLFSWPHLFDSARIFMKGVSRRRNAQHNSSSNKTNTDLLFTWMSRVLPEWSGFTWGTKVLPEWQASYLNDLGLPEEPRFYLNDLDFPWMPRVYLKAQCFVWSGQQTHTNPRVRLNYQV